MLSFTLLLPCLRLTEVTVAAQPCGVRGGPVAFCIWRRGRMWPACRRGQRVVACSAGSGRWRVLRLGLVAEGRAPGNVPVIDAGPRGRV